MHRAVRSEGWTRRRFLGALPASAGALLVVPLHAARPGRIVHPDPRPGIDGSAVLSRDALAGLGGEVIEVYDMVREMPHIADGIGCSCGCSAMPTYRSLLTCFHAEGMARGCAICQAQARLAHRRFREGQTLDQIRRATDARFG